MNKRLKNILKRTGLVLLGAIVLFFLLDLVFPMNTHIDYAPVIEARDGTVLHAYLTKDQQWRMRIRKDEITPELKQAILFKEDRYFYRHPGVNILAIGRAVFNNIAHLKRTSGASTITMQVARMLDPKPRTYLNKIIEMFRALQLELHYSKDQILQLYLDLVPYGSNIQGIKAASVLYLNKTPEQLSLAEITALSIIPNRPNSLVIGKNNNAIVAERNKWIVRFKDARLFPDDIINDALQEPLTAYRHNAPASVPQLSWRLIHKYAGQPELHTTIDRRIQLSAENLAGNYINTLKLRGINNAAVLIIDNKTHEVAAYIGSADFNDKFHNGQVDGVNALRSPGSTLKPLLYGLAFDKGYVTPKSMIADVPVNFAGYTPENYDMQYRGNVSVEDALRLSLNIPAVKLLDHLGTAAFVHTMINAGFYSMQPYREHAGLSIILGGYGVRLDELTNLYSAFANDGNYFPLRWMAADSNINSFVAKADNKPVSVLSAEADYMVSEILSQLHRPDLPNFNDQATGIPKIAWKTGTSYGRKDAWSIGYNKHYTIGVWTGNFSGQGVPALNGAEVATPLLFQLFNAIDRQADVEWLQAPPGIGFRLVCAKSGQLPDTFCNEQVMDYYIPGVSGNERCEHLKKVWVSANGQYSYCTSCLPPNGYKTEMLPNISAELAAYYELSHIDYDHIPPHNPACSRSQKGNAPVITSLTDGMTYLVPDRQQQMQLGCSVANDVHMVYWYVNDKYAGTAKAGKTVLFVPPAEQVKISCTDDMGRTSNIHIHLKFM